MCAQQPRKAKTCMLRNRFAAACALSIVIFIVLPLAAIRMQGAERQARTLSIVALSDLHEVYKSRRLHVPPGDVLIIAGDIELSDEGDAARFNGWVKSLPHPLKLYTPGNMDTWTEDQSSEQLAKSLDALTVIRDEVKQVGGLRVFASPATPQFYGAYQLDGRHAAADHWAKVLPPSTEVDILVTHGPPHGYGDSARGKHVGDLDLLNAVQSLKVPPKLWICGHIHEGRGQYTIPHSSGAQITLLNVAVAYLGRGDLTVQPWVIQMDLDSKSVTSVRVADPPEEAVKEQEAEKGRKLWSAPWGMEGMM